MRFKIYDSKLIFSLESIIELIVICLNFLIYCKYYASLDSEIIEVCELMTKVVILVVLFLLLLIYIVTVFLIIAPYLRKLIKCCRRRSSKL